MIREGKREREMKRPHDLSVTNSRPDRCPQKFIRISYASGMSANSHTGAWEGEKERDGWRERVRERQRERVRKGARNRATGRERKEE